jgi:alpha-tubulin suppressor-like RCC1 family protein
LNNYVCTFLTTGVAYAWGFGTNGQLGLGHEDDVSVPETIRGRQLENRLVLAASAGGQHTVLLVKEKPPAEAAEAPNNPKEK